MKTYIKKEDGGILMHSDTYLGEDYTSPNMIHWKYIKKEKKNGRWVYYYDDSAYKVSDKELITDWANRYNSKNEYDRNNKTYNEMKDAVAKSKNQKNKQTSYVSNHQYYRTGESLDRFAVNKDNEKYWKNKASKSKNEYNKNDLIYKSTYKKAQTYDKTSEKIKRVAAKIGAKTLDTLSSGIHKAKNFLKSIFS